MDTDSNKAAIVIPSRFGSSRFPGKPLAKLQNKPIIQWVVEAALKSKYADLVVVATDHDEIASVSKNAGAVVAMTEMPCRTGSDRVWEAVKLLGLDHEVIVNLQGDEPMIRPQDLDLTIRTVLRGEAPIATLCSDLHSDEELRDPNCVKVRFNDSGLSEKFSRDYKKFMRDPNSEVEFKELIKNSALCRHVGLYVYKRSALEQFSAAEQPESEKSENLEQLRAVFCGIPIRVLRSDFVSLGIDTPEDLKALESELISAN